MIKALTRCSEWTRLGEKAGNIRFFNSTICEIHLEPNAISRARFQVLNERGRCLLTLCQLKYARVLLARVALIYRTVNVYVLELGIGNAAPVHLNSGRLDFRNINNNFKTICVDLLSSRYL